MLPLHASSLLVYIVDQWQIYSALHPFDFARNLFNFLVCVLFFFFSEFKILGTVQNHVHLFKFRPFAVVDNLFVIL